MTDHNLPDQVHLPLLTRPRKKDAGSGIGSFDIDSSVSGIMERVNLRVSANFFSDSLGQDDGEKR